MVKKFKWKDLPDDPSEICSFDPAPCIKMKKCVLVIDQLGELLYAAYSGDQGHRRIASGWSACEMGLAPISSSVFRVHGVFCSWRFILHPEDEPESGLLLVMRALSESFVEALAKATKREISRKTIFRNLSENTLRWRLWNRIWRRLLCGCRRTSTSPGATTKSKNEKVGRK